MAPSSSIIPYLFLATFAIVIVYGVMQFFKAKKAKAEGHTSASARQGDDAGQGRPSTGGATTATKQTPTDSASPPIVPR